jgi:DNA polymerase V
MMVIDRSLEPQNHKIAVCLIEGEFTVKRLKIAKEGIYLMPENDSFKPILVTEDHILTIWGIVTYVIKKM